MSAGYGRGYYGSEQLAPKPSGRGWIGTAIVLAGVGAIAWLVWPRRPRTFEPPSAPPPPLSPPSGDDLEQIARSKGFSSTEAFENSVVATARDLEASGAKVELGPHLQHLVPRLET